VFWTEITAICAPCWVICASCWVISSSFLTSDLRQYSVVYLIGVAQGSRFSAETNQKPDCNLHHSVIWTYYNSSVNT
jgi:hypothetical protein